MWRNTTAVLSGILIASAVMAPVGRTEAADERGGAGPGSGEPWRGIHLLLRDDRSAERVIAELDELASIGVNVLIFEINYHFEFRSHPELRSERRVSRETAGRLAAACRQRGIRPIPMFNCLGHQSWERTTFELLSAYPRFDETPGQFPDNEGIYCRSWCPLHPEVNEVVFALMDELIDAFSADAFHVGMDEVFLIASEHCPRCKGRDPAELFAKAVNDYHEHLAGRRGVEVLMWGDRLLDAEATGYGRWEAAANGTAGAIDRVPTDIIICDWHYGRRDDYPSIPLFLEKGFRVWPAGWNKPEATRALVDFAQRHNGDRLLGHLCTTWGAVGYEELGHWPPIREAMRAWGGIGP